MCHMLLLTCKKKNKLITHLVCQLRKLCVSAIANDHFRHNSQYTSVLSTISDRGKMQSLGTKMATKAIEKSVKKELKSAVPQAPSGGARLRSEIYVIEVATVLLG